MPRTDPTPLTPEQEADFRAVAADLHRRGVPVSRIARDLGVTPGTARGFLAAEGVGVRPAGSSPRPPKRP